MASKTVQPIAIELGIKGGEKLAALNRSFRDLSKQTKLSDRDINQATKDIVKFAKEVGNSEATIKGQIKAFEGLREQAAMGGKVYRELGANIQNLKASLKGATVATQLQAQSFSLLGKSSGASVEQISKAIKGLEQLRKETRLDSEAFVSFGKDIAELTQKLKKAEAQTESLAQARKRSSQGLGGGSVALGQRIRDSKLLVDQLRAEQQAVEASKAKFGASSLFDKGAKSKGRSTFEDAVAGAALGLKVKDILTPADFKSALGEGERIVADYQANIEQTLKKGVGASFQQAARSARESSRVMAAAFADPELLNALSNIDKRLGSLPETTAGYSQKLRELEQQLANTAISSDKYVAVALRIAQVQREATATAQGLGAALVKDLASGNTVRNQKNLREAIGQLQAEMNELNTETAEGSSKYAENARQVNNLQKELDEIAGSYRNVTDMARQASAAQGVYANTSVGGNYLRRGIVRQQEAARAELGAAVRAGVASTPLLLPAAGQTTAPGTGLERSGGALPLIPESRRGFAQESFAKLQGPKQYLPGPALPPGFAEKLRQRNISEAESLRKLNEEKRVAKKVSEDLSASVSKARIANNDSVDGVNRLRSALDKQRNTLPRSSKAFKELSEEIGALDRRSEKVSRRMSRRKFSPGKAAQVAGATISGGIFGGPEGFLGGAIGGALGGVGGSFAGAALGAQVGQLRQQLGGFAEYAASIERLKIALNGIAGDASNYNRALQAAADVTKELNIPQEVAIKGITRLTAAVKGAGGGIADAELAFKNINSAIIATGGGAEQVEGAVTALVQIFSKGKVSAEEINQIAERLPGTFNKIAEASGRTGPELTKALQKGEVGLNDLMKFLVQLGGEYGELAEKIAGSSESAGARLTVAYNKMRIEIGKALQPIGAEFQEAFADFVENITPTLVATLPKLGAIFLEVAKNLDVLAAAATAAGLAMGIIAVKAAVIKAQGIVALFKGIATAATAAGVATKGMSAAVLLNPWVLLAAGVTAATVGVVKYYQGQKELNELLDEGKGTTETIKEKMQEYRDEITKATAKLKGINGEQKATGRQANALKTKVAELRSELERLDGTYKIRIKFESKGFKYNDEGEMVEFTSGGIVYGGPRGARAKALRRVDGTPLEGLTDYGSPADEDDKDKDKGSGKARKSQLPQLQDKYDSLIRSGPLADIQRFQIANSLALVRAQKDNNTELVYTIKNNAINLDFGEKELGLKNKYLDAMNAANKTEDIAERQLQEKIAGLERDLGLEKLIVSANGELLALKQDQAIASEIIAKASEDELFNLRDQLGLVTNEQRIERFRQSRVDAGDPNAEQQTDLFRQTIDPTLTEGLSQNIRSLKKELEDLVNPINQITGAANAIGSAFSQSFTNAITGATSAKQALSDFFKSVASYFLDMAGQIIAKMVTMAVLNTVVKLLPGGGGGIGFNPNAPSITGNSLGDFGGGSFGGFMANGGPVSANTPYIVGERGPELMVPSGNGTIIPNDVFSASRAAISGGGPLSAAGNSGDLGKDGMAESRNYISNNYSTQQAIAQSQAAVSSSSMSMERVIERKAAERQATEMSEPIRVKLDTTVINNVEYLTVEQGLALSESASRKARSQVFSDLRQRPASRSKVGLG